MQSLVVLELDNFQVVGAVAHALNKCILRQLSSTFNPKAHQLCQSARALQTLGHPTVPLWQGICQ